MRVYPIISLTVFVLCGLVLASNSDWDDLTKGLITRTPRPLYGRFRGPDDEVMVGKGDRFEGGDFFPYGAGTGKRPNNGTNHEFESILNRDEIHSALAGLRKEYDIQVMDLPHASVEGRKGIMGLISCDPEYYPYSTDVRCGSPRSYKVLITGGLNPRERSTPDSIIYFIADLLYAKKHDMGLDYGNVTYTAEEVKRAASVGILFYPLVNEDGTVYDQEQDQCWNRNLNNASMVEDIDWSNFTVGVDINRNFDFIFDYWRVLNASLADNFNSNRSASEHYQGLQPMSEQETKNIKWTFEAFPKIRWLLDTHTYGGRVYYPWGTAPFQTNDTTKNWQNEEWDGQRGPTVNETYREYMVEADHYLYYNISRHMGDTLVSIDNTTVSVGEPGGMGPLSGTLIDWAYARHIVDPSTEKVYSFALFFNDVPTSWKYETQNRIYCAYYPDKRRLNVGMREAAVSFMTFLLEVWERAV